MTAAVAIGAIDLYQQLISPYKGFRCAHRVRHGRASCSQFAKRLLAKVGLMRFAPLFMRRLKRCSEAATALKTSLVDRKRPQGTVKRELHGGRACDPAAGCAPPDIGGCGPTGYDAGACDVGGCDVPAGDCAGGCDFSL